MAKGKPLRIVFTVTNDLNYDQRMDRICSSLSEAGYRVTLVGRRRAFSDPLREKTYRQVRISCFFNRGKLFYLEYNIRLFLYLSTQKFDIVCGIDLDTILPTWFQSKLRRKKFVYDAHEYFTEMEEVVSRPVVQKAWSMIERSIVPKVEYGYTVSEGYADLFRKKYGADFEIIRNATVLNKENGVEPKGNFILYQGAVNVGRGLEELVAAMPFINSNLVICGKGDVYKKLQGLVKELGLQQKVVFKGYVHPEKLKNYTFEAAVGITIFTNEGLSNRYSLANRFFDYMHAGVPQIAMNYPEYKSFNERYKVAHLIDEVNEKSIAEAINRLLEDSEYYESLKNNCFEARKEYNWQREEKKLLKFYEEVVE